MVICILWELRNKSVIKFHGGGIASIVLRHFSLDIRHRGVAAGGAQGAGPP